MEYASEAFIPTITFRPRIRVSTLEKTKSLISSRMYMQFNKSEKQSQSQSYSRRQILKDTAAIGLLNLLNSAINPRVANAAQRRGLDKGVAEQVLKNARYPIDWPYTKADFRRYDETTDGEFYSSPRYTRHIDDDAVKALTKFHTKFFKNGDDILDLCASIESYVPPFLQTNIIGLGMNEDELKANSRLSSWNICDLNIDPKLPYKANSFDFVICALSIDYLTKPLDVCEEIGRVLKPNGQVLISFSDRVFSTKAVQMWMGSSNEDHIYIVASYLHYCHKFADIQVDDISPRRIGNSLSGDPLYVISAKRALSNTEI